MTLTYQCNCEFADGTLQSLEATGQVPRRGEDLIVKRGPDVDDEHLIVVTVEWVLSFDGKMSAAVRAEPWHKWNALRDTLIRGDFSS
jgi:hypothetical protein